MEPGTPAQHIRRGPPSDMMSVMVTLERPSSQQLTSYDRREKYALLKQNAAKIREELVEWIADRGLSEEVGRVGKPNAFNALFVTCTPRAAELLEQAPGVVSVIPTGEFKVDLLRSRVEDLPPLDPRSDASEVEG
jgi:hypothetical protein